MSPEKETDKRPLAKRITQGNRYRWQGTRNRPDSLTYFGVELGPNILYMAGSSPTPADAELISEAFNVTHETGRTPRQLAAELRAERDAQEAFAIRTLSKEAYDNSPCQAHPLELVENHFKAELQKLRKELADAYAAAREGWRLSP